jgi:hypothetical protein
LFTRIISEGVPFMKLLGMRSSPAPRHLVPLRPKCFPQHPILKHPQPVLSSV